MANTRKASKKPVAKKPMNVKAFMASLNSPWRGLGDEVDKVTQIYYPEPNISLPKINYELLNNRLKTAQERTKSRNAVGGYYQALQKGYEDPKAAGRGAGGVTGVIAGLFTYAAVSGEQYDRLSSANQKKIGELFADNHSLVDMGSDPVKQNDGLVNRIFDVLSRFEYAGATVQHENGKKDLDLLELANLGQRALVDPVKQFLTNDRTPEQISFDADMAKREEYEKQLAEIAARSGTDSTEYVSLRTVYDNWMASKESERGTYHPAANPVYGNWNKPRPEGDFETVYETDRYKQLQKMNKKDKLNIDLIPDVIPTSKDEAESWMKGFTGKSKRTYTQNLIEDKKYSQSDAWMAGLTMAVVLDPSTYVTGGMIGSAVGTGRRAVGLGRAGTGLLNTPTLEKVPDLLRLLEKPLAGVKIRLGDDVFEVGKDGIDKLDSILKGGPRQARNATPAEVARHQKRILNDLTNEMNTAIKVRYASLNDELMALKKSLKKASNPAAIEQQFINLSNRVAAMNLDKAVADSLEELIRRGDILDVPQPKYKVDLPNAADDVVEAEVTKANQRFGNRLRYVREQREKMAARAAEKMPRRVDSVGSARGVVGKAKKVMTYTSLSKVPLARVVEETLALVKENVPGMAKALEAYEEYLRTYGDEVLTVDDIVTHPVLKDSGLIAPEIRQVQELFDISDFAKVEDSVLGRMFLDMGYTRNQAERMLARYKEAVADNHWVKMNREFSATSPKMVDRTLDWADVAKARTANAKTIDSVIKGVKADQEQVAQNIGEFLAEIANDFGAKTGARSALELRVAGVPLVHITTPESVNRAFNSWLEGSGTIARGFSATQRLMKEKFRGYSQLGAELNAARTQFVGGGEQIIQATLGHLHKLYGGSTKRTQRDIMGEWLTGATPEISKKYGAHLASLDSLFLDLREYAPGLLRVGDLSEVSARDLSAVINRWLPKEFHLAAETMESVRLTSKHEFLTPDWFRDYYRKVYPLGTKRKSFLTPSALELEWQMRMSMEKSIARVGLLNNVEETFGVRRPANPDAAWKVLSSGPPNVKWQTAKYYDQEVFFPPQIRNDIVRLMEMVDNRSTSEIASGGFARLGTFWKAAVTVYNIPEYFIRNALSDGWMMFFANVNPKYFATGANVLADTGVYMKALRENPEFARAFALADKNNKEAIARAMSLADRSTRQQGNKRAMTFAVGFTDNNGSKVTQLSSIEMLKHYYTLGLETNFVRTSLGAVREAVPTISRNIGDPIKIANSYGEDVRRMTMFADGLAKAERAGIKNFDEALNYAAEHTRKYLFDYSDFSNFERNFLGRLVPFYKWTRKAVPLLTEMLIFKPGKIAVMPKMLEAQNTAAGAPPADGENYPWMATADAVIPTWMRLNPMMYMGDNSGPDGETFGTYGAIPNPFSETFSRIVDPVIPGGETIDPSATPNERLTKYLGGVGAMGVSQISPQIRAPFEMALQQTAFGANELGGRPLDDVTEYGMNMFPQIGKTQDLMEGGQFNDLSSILGFLGAMNVQENDSNKQMSEMMFIQQILRTALDKTRKEYDAKYLTEGE